MGNLKLYHSIISVCAQKVRIALADKGLEYDEKVMCLRGDQFDPAYLRLNPNALVPTLVHDGRPIIESTVILHYLDETFPEPALMPTEPFLRARVRLFTKLIDEYIHRACSILTFATAFRPAMTRLTDAEREAILAPQPNQKKAEYKRDVIANGLESHFVVESLRDHDKLLSWIEEATQTSAYLAGERYSIADVAVIPYVARLDLLRLGGLWDDRPGVAAWYARMRQRPSVELGVFGRMSQTDFAAFANFEPDPLPTAREILGIV